MTNPVEVVRDHRPEMTLVACQLADHTPDFEHECLARQCSADQQVFNGFFDYQQHLIRVMEASIT